MNFSCPLLVKNYVIILHIGKYYVSVTSERFHKNTNFYTKIFRPSRTQLTNFLLIGAKSLK